MDIEDFLIRFPLSGDSFPIKRSDKITYHDLMWYYIDITNNDNPSNITFRKGMYILNDGERENYINLNFTCSTDIDKFEQNEIAYNVGQLIRDYGVLDFKQLLIFLN